MIALSATLRVRSKFQIAEKARTAAGRIGLSYDQYRAFRMADNGGGVRTQQIGGDIGTVRRNDHQIGGKDFAIARILSFGEPSETCKWTRSSGIVNFFTISFSRDSDSALRSSIAGSSAV